eukprot:TRINITY_DN2279_c0_g2_i1.p1 TRINITY_DN2279_c0_g2~~TRINITY_DN2279_c0_g2_i1.p1  ORF type:complete len:106 (+),score=5.14 TRINITY_DN2279_c0_g2_i1:186-503(+)
MVHPQVPGILFTPICPHSLSFRPIILPDCVEYGILVPDDARATAWVSFDGKKRVELKRGDYLSVKISKYPFVWVNPSGEISGWFKSVGECLHWNFRTRQKPNNKL